jgi:phosphoribosyl-AMP cyclohydrolase
MSQISANEHPPTWIGAIRWTADGLVPAIAQDANNGDLLMMAWMNPESLQLTVTEGQAVYWSRSRGKLWRKGESSGHVQHLVDMRVDCDRDCLLVLVDQTGPACHTNRRSCFYTALRDGAEVEIMAPVADPD